MRSREQQLRRTLAVAAMGLAVLAAFVGTPVAPAHVAPVAMGDGERVDTFVTRTVDALQLAAWIREGARDVRVLDLRGASAYEARHIPSAEPADRARLDTLTRRTDGTLVLYSGDDVRDAQALANLVARGHRQAYVLNGGIDAWMDEVIDPVLHGDSADYVAALSRYFGGVPRASDTPRPEPKARVELPAATSGEPGEAPRRGC